MFTTYKNDLDKVIDAYPAPCTFSNSTWTIIELRETKLLSLTSAWFLVFGFWLMAYGIWLMAYGLWLLAFGFWPINQRIQHQRHMNFVAIAIRSPNVLSAAYQ